MEAKNETLTCPDGCPTCPCGSTDPSCQCWCAHDGKACDHLPMTTLSGIRFAGVVVLAKINKKYGITAKTYANKTQAENAVKSANLGGRPAWVIGDRPYFVRLG